DKKCKHIISCQLLQDSIVSQSDIEQTQQPKICPKCYSTTIIKNGFRKIKNGTKRQKHSCKQCKYRFILGENGFSNVTSDPRIISESLNLIMSGMSYRNVTRHIHSTHQVKISHPTIVNWVKKYTNLIKKYVETFNPELSDVWSLDEMMLNVKNTKKTGKGFHDWLWSIIDPKTRFLIATEVSKKREIADAKKIISSGKKLVSQNPNYILTDCLNSYQAAKIDEFQKILQQNKKIKTIIFTQNNKMVYTLSNKFLIPNITYRTIKEERRDVLEDSSLVDIMW
ncbi:MAG: DDE-type integrase/transposase/recombinase, partial [Nitrosopumilus sp.]|nr:DDE-type integrase/transposase/recombinase [Nitrosopumilus sp.]